MSLLSRRRLMNMEEEADMKVILDTEFTLETTITASAITEIEKMDTGISENDLADGDVVIAEIRMLECFDSETSQPQCIRFEFLHITDGGYCEAGYIGGNPASYPTDDKENTALVMATNGGVYVYGAGRWLSTLTISGRNNGSPKPVAGRYQLLLYKTGFNTRKDYRE